MGAWTRRFTEQSLFNKMFMVTVLSILSVTVLTTWVTVQMSQKLFVQTFSITNSKIIEQIKNGLESFHYANVNIAINVAQSGAIKSFLTEPDADSLSNYKSYYSMVDQMKRIQSGNGTKNIGIAVLGANNRSYISDRTYWYSPMEELLHSSFTQNAWKQPGKIGYSLIGEDMGDTTEPRILAAKALNAPGEKEIYGTLYMMIKESDFRNVYASFTSAGNDVMIVDTTGTIVSSNRSELIGTKSVPLLESAEHITQQGLANQELKMFGKDVIALADYLPMFDFYIVNVIDKESTLGHMLNRKAIFLIVAAIAATALLLVYIFTRRVTKSMRTLVKKMSNVTKKNFHNYMAVGGSYETRELSNAFNYMLDELNDYLKRLVETQNEQRRAELAALQQQINPHFLYNTLASVNILVQRGSKEKATETIHALISLLQNTISNVKETISVKEELVNLKHYVFINQIRYGDGIKVDYFVPPDCMAAQVPKLILQPFMENAFFMLSTKRIAAISMS
ncbi:cache domain-containing sensor histidine kinase [Paenibacillus hexagrammi]|uniref:cache domain-containing sensor histidine kinase n=1 Tax=Paenibacillus hexagrammi TaxID=2908839 RepID=UPI0028831558|nr:histidine kinase [Paenibacillus sp. YPD9-1]